jgi:hypothetical protein
MESQSISCSFARTELNYVRSENSIKEHVEQSLMSLPESLWIHFIGQLWLNEQGYKASMKLKYVFRNEKSWADLHASSNDLFEWWRWMRNVRLVELDGGRGGEGEIRIEFIPINLNIACGNAEIT